MDLTSVAQHEADFDLVHADLMRFFPTLVSELGGDPDALMRRAGIEPGVAGARPRLGYRAWVHLLEQAAVELQRPDFGLRLAALQGGGRVFGPMGVVMRNSATFRAYWGV